MDAVLRAVFIYFFLVALLRISGKRTVSQMDTLDLVLLLIISEATEHAMLGEDHSITNTVVVIGTLVGLNIGMTWLKLRWPWLERWFSDRPLVIVEDGRPLRDRMLKARVDEGDVMAAARELQGLERMEQIKLAVLESTGGTTIIPKPNGRAAPDAGQRDGPVA